MPDSLPYQPAIRFMDPGDVALLVVLGTAEGSSATMEEVAGTARLLAPQDWQPTSEVLTSCISRALSADLLTTDSREEANPRLHTTDAGRKCIGDLLRKSIPPGTGGFTRTCMSVKLCFLHHLPALERSEQMRDLMYFYQQELAVRVRLKRLQRPAATTSARWVCHEIERLESELAWLQGMNTWLLMPGRAAE
jgi:hypothetical protein